MPYRYVNVDLFDIKDDILEKFTIKELKEELEQREEDGIKEEDERTWYTFCHDIEIDLSDVEDDVLDYLSDYQLEDELNNRGYTVTEDGKIDENLTKRNLAVMLGLREWATIEQIIEEIKILL